jgi:hypothetical protein
MRDRETMKKIVLLAAFLAGVPLSAPGMRATR